jgi:hypothetical protein
LLYREASDEESEDSENEGEGIRVGDAYQASIPLYQQHRPAQPTDKEARFLSCPLYTPIQQLEAAAGGKRGRTKASFTAAAAAGAAHQAAAVAHDDVSGGLNGQDSGREEVAGPSGRGGGVWDPVQLQRYALQLKAIERPAARLSMLEEILNAQDAAMGQELVVKLGLDRLGVKLRASWEREEEVLFAESMFRKYKMFKWMRKW